MPKVSICIPTYNNLSAFKRCIKSVLEQTYTDYEIVISDDSTNNEIGDYLKTIQNSDKIIYKKNEIPLGSPENWNEAIRNANGELIKIIHHDDWFPNENCLEKFVKAYIKFPKSKLIFSQSYIEIEGQKTRIHSINENDTKTLINIPSIILTKNLIGAPTATIFRKNSQFLFDNKLKWLVDIDFYFKMIRNETFTYIPEPLVTTYAAKGRVTDECLNNKNIEVKEFFHVFESALKIKNLPYREIKPLLIHAFSIIRNFSLSSLKDIRECGFVGKIHICIIIYLILRKKSKLIANSFEKIVVKV